jgi:hypothetical protein
MLGQQRIPAIAQMTARKLNKLYRHDFFFMRV